jgi:hypothetical protein
MRNKKIALFLVLGIFGFVLLTYAQNSPEIMADSPPMKQNLTLWDMIMAGGTILWITAALGFIGLVWAIYLLLTLTPKRELPPTLIRSLIHLLQAGDYKGVMELCEGRDELIAKMVFAGVKLVGHDQIGRAHV